MTTLVDAGGSGWRNFEDFKTRVIDRQRTRVLALLNIVGNGMRGGKFENNLEDMEAGPTGEMAKKHKGVIVGIKTAHYAGPEWAPVERAVEAGTAADIPVMVDFGSNHPDTRPLADLVTKKLRPGDIYTHMYSGLRNELVDGKPNPGMIEGRKRGVIFDVGHGGGSFLWRVAVPMVKAGFVPDSISTDLHIGSMNAGMKDHAERDGQVPRARHAARSGHRACRRGTRRRRSSRSSSGISRPAPSPTSRCCDSRRGSSASST